jgi:hypothetical protein
VDVVVTLPKSFGLDRWMAEGDAPGEPWSGRLYEFTVSGVPNIKPGERVYVVHDGRPIGYAPLVKVRVTTPSTGPRRTALIRGGGAVACTLNRHIPGFRGFRYRWWNRDEELPARATCAAEGCNEEFDLGYEFPGLCGGDPFPDHGCGRPFCERHLFMADERRDLALCRECCEGYMESIFEPAVD